MTLVIERNRPHSNLSRYNFTAGVIDGVGWPLGMAIFSTTTLLPDFLLKLHASYLLIGLLPAMISLGYLLPGIFVASRVSKMVYVRPYLFWVGLVERVPLFLIALLTYSVGYRNTNLLLFGFYSLFLLHAIALGFNQPSYWSLIGKLIPADRRGRMFGTAGLIGGLLGIGVDPVTHLLLSRAAAGSLHGYADCFLLAAIIILVSFLPFGGLREHAGDPIAPADSSGDSLLDDIKRVWRSDRGYRRLVLAQLTFSAWSMAPPFFMAAAIFRLHIGPELVALYTTVNVVSLAFGNIAWGAIGDRLGNKIVLVCASCVMIAGTVPTLFHIGGVGYEFVFALTALGAGGLGIAGYNVVLEFAPSQNDMSHYLATMNGMNAVVRVIAPLAGGLIATRFGFSPVFALASIFGVLTLFATIAMKEPRGRVGVAIDAEGENWSG